MSSFQQKLSKLYYSTGTGSERRKRIYIGAYYYDDAPSSTRKRRNRIVILCIIVYFVAIGISAFTQSSAQRQIPFAICFMASFLCGLWMAYGLFGLLSQKGILKEDDHDDVRLCFGPVAVVCAVLCAAAAVFGIAGLILVEPAAHYALPRELVSCAGLLAAAVAALIAHRTVNYIRYNCEPALDLASFDAASEDALLAELCRQHDERVYRLRNRNA